MKTMDQQPNYYQGITGTVLSIVSAIFAWINLQNVQVLMAIIASCVAAGSGLLAGWHWWLSIQEKRHNIKKLKKPKS